MQQDTERNTRLVESIDQVLEEMRRLSREKAVHCLRLTDEREVVIVLSNDMTVSRLYVTGRPDGRRPHGRDSYYDYFSELLDGYVEQNGSDEGFELATEEWQLLFREGTDRYVRYLFFSSIKRWGDVERDTRMNMDLCEMAKKYAPSDIAWQIYQYKGYILMMHTMARAEQKLMHNEQSEALSVLDEGIEALGQFCGICLREEHEDAENITRENYLHNLVQYRADLESIGQRLEERVRMHHNRRVGADDLEELLNSDDEPEMLTF